MAKKVFITGVAGFIGFHLTSRLLQDGYDIYGIDNMNSYYDVELKKSRIEILRRQNLQTSGNFEFEVLDLVEKEKLKKFFCACGRFDNVINLAAQAGVRYSISNPSAYIESNVIGFNNLLEIITIKNTRHLIFASSSSVYGKNSKIPFNEMDSTDHPISLYAASKKSNEVMAHAHSHLYQIPTTGLRFFTVYGPYGRPDMAYFKFTKLICDGEPIDVYNSGNLKRDFTYIDDIVNGIIGVMDFIPKKGISKQSYEAPFSIYNIGNNDPIDLERFIKSIELATGKKAIKNYLPMQMGDVPITFADVDNLRKDIGFHPSISIEEGMKKFVEWYIEYTKKNSSF